MFRNRSDVTMVSWTLTTTCNYACSYCPAALHDGKHRFPNPGGMEAFLRHLVSESPVPIYLDILGGEPTLWPELDSFLSSVEDLIGNGKLMVELITNGSRTLRWWGQNASRFHQVVISLHTEHADVDHIVAVVRLLQQHTAVKVNIMTHPDRFEIARAAFSRLVQIPGPLAVEMKFIRENFGSELLDYTIEQRAEIVSSTFERRDPKRITPTTDFTRFVDDDGVEMVWKDLQAAGLNTWVGKRCSIGRRRFVVEANGDIRRAACGVGGVIGNLTTGWTLPEQDVVCDRPRCPCLADAMAPKGP